MKKLFLSIFICLFIFTACKDDKTQRTVTTPDISFTKDGELRLIKKETDSVIKTLDIEIADDDYKTQTGLMYREAMEENEGMLFIFPDSQVRSFYMKNTQFALDIIFIGADKKIVSFQKNAQPYNTKPLPSGESTKYVLEINSGLSDAWALEVGDKIEWDKNAN